MSNKFANRKTQCSSLVLRSKCLTFSLFLKTLNKARCYRHNIAVTPKDRN